MIKLNTNNVNSLLKKKVNFKFLLYLASIANTSNKICTPQRAMALEFKANHSRISKMIKAMVVAGVLVRDDKIKRTNTYILNWSYFNIT